MDWIKAYWEISPAQSAVAGTPHQFGDEQLCCCNERGALISNPKKLKFFI